MPPISEQSSVAGCAVLQEAGELHTRSQVLRLSLSFCLNQFEAWAQKRPLLFAAAIVTVLFAVVIWSMPPAYQTNDDAFMNMVAAGQFITLEPDEHLFCTNVIIGKLLKSLYLRFPGVLWYGWYLMTTQWIATIALLCCFLQPNYSRLRMLYFLLYFVTFGSYFIVKLQFTTTAMLSGLAGAMLLLLLLRRPSIQGWRNWMVAASAGLFLIWSGLIRSESFLLTMLLACPVFGVAYWFGHATRQTGLAVCTVLGLATCSLYLASKYDQEAYREPAWQSFYQYAHSFYNKLFDMRLIDYNPETQHVFDQVGWSENDFELMLSSYYYEDSIFDAQTLNKILASHPWIKDREYGALLWETVETVCCHRTIQAILCCLPLLLFIFDRNRLKDRWLCVLAVVVAVALLPALAFMRKPPPERVFLPVLAFSWLVFLSSLALQCGVSRKFFQVIQTLKFSWQYRNWSLTKAGWSKHLLLRSITLFLAFGLGLNLKNQNRQGKYNAKNAEVYESMLSEIRAATIDSGDSGRPVVAFARDFPYECFPALFRRSDYQGLHICCVGWLQRSPLAEAMKKRYGITSLGQALAERDDILVITSVSTRKYLIRYLVEHYAPDLQMVYLKRLQRALFYRTCFLTKIQSIPNHDESSSHQSAALPVRPITDFLIKR